MIRANYLVMRYAPMIGRDGRRFVTVAARCYGLAGALEEAALFRQRTSAAFWIVKPGQPAHRRLALQSWNLQS